MANATAGCGDEKNSSWSRYGWWLRLVCFASRFTCLIHLSDTAGKSEGQVVAGSLRDCIGTTLVKIDWFKLFDLFNCLSGTIMVRSNGTF